MVKKAFSELTPRGQKARIAKHEKELKEQGLTETLASIVLPAKFYKNSDGSDSARFRLRLLNTETNEVKWVGASAYIPAPTAENDRKKLHDFYANLKKGQLVSLTYNENVVGDKTYVNIRSMFPREKKAKVAK